MRALVVYESMFGNTHTIARHIAEGIDTVGESNIVSVHDATPELCAAADLVVVGQCPQLDTVRFGACRKRFGLERAVGDSGVAVEVSVHPARWGVHLTIVKTLAPHCSRGPSALASRHDSVGDVRFFSP